MDVLFCIRDLGRTVAAFKVKDNSTIILEPKNLR